MLADELHADRWRWVEESLAWLRSGLFAEEEPLPDTGANHVMVVGDAQVGKTTLLIRLLGVTTPEAVAEVEHVLRAGRAKGNSATAAPMRYRWSADPDRWMLVRGPDRPPSWLTSAELHDELATLRTDSGRRLTWNPDDRPLELGLPTRLAAEEVRAELRILDLPGLFAAEDAEREAAHRLVSRYAPVMNLIVFVQQADKMADAFNDPAIRDSAQLAAWTEDVELYRVVLTRSFKDASVRRRASTAIAAGASTADLVAEVRNALAQDLADSLTTPVTPSSLASVLYPVDLGDSWSELGATRPDFAAAVEPARDKIFTDLVESLQIAADDTRQHLAAPDLALRIAARIRHRRTRRQQALQRPEQELAEAQAALETLRQAVDRATAIRDEALAREQAHRRAIDVLRRRPIRYRRPDPPAMEATAVRAHQQQERDAWLDAGRRTWQRWRSASDDIAAAYVRTRAPLDEAGVHAAYDHAVGCCGRCGNSLISALLGKAPADCYRRMGDATSAMTAWVRSELVTGAETALTRLQGDVTRAEQRLTVARTEYGHQQTDVDRLRAAYDTAVRVDAEESDREEADLAVAATLTTVLNARNRTYVEDLDRRARAAPATNRHWYVLAALQAMRDLDEMMRTA